MRRAVFPSFPLAAGPLRNVILKEGIKTSQITAVSAAVTTKSLAMATTSLSPSAIHQLLRFQLKSATHGGQPLAFCVRSSSCSTPPPPSLTTNTRRPLRPAAPKLLLSSQLLRQCGLPLPSALQKLTLTEIHPFRAFTTTKASATEGGSTSDSSTGPVSKADQLKRAVKDYGSTVIVFHVAISLASLGFFYLIVSR